MTRSNASISRRSVLALGAAAAGQALLGRSGLAADEPKRTVVVWSEGTAPKNVYPHDINTTVADGLKPLSNWEIVVASLSQPHQGISDDLLAKTDVLIWWGHKHQRRREEIDLREGASSSRVNDKGMGFIALHSAHYSKALKALLKTPCGWKGGYVEDGSKLDVVIKAKDHPIAAGLSDFTLPHTERYTEPFECPEPETLVFDGVYTRPDGSTENSRQGLVFATPCKGKCFTISRATKRIPFSLTRTCRRRFAMPSNGWGRFGHSAKVRSSAFTWRRCGRLRLSANAPPEGGTTNYFSTSCVPGLKCGHAALYFTGVCVRSMPASLSRSSLAKAASTSTATSANCLPPG